ncbi:hypothetical protein [uncultured Tenacibaculum sp.]|uniref:hypothetical protein n=1 Tax=uncultured Tenacibaculum sp. TaxID=174713 RepID=UPI00262FF607|nr:hypothetical protein [uncultured Tenacibaculum sp.]
MENKEKKKNYIKPLFWVAVISSWIFFVFPLIWLLPFAFWVLFLIVLLIRKSDLTWKLLLFSSWSLLPLFSLVGGIGNYLDGNARLKGVGYPGFGFSNLDKEYRVYRSTSGCIFIGNEFFTHAPNNFMVKLCTTLFGYQKGVYTGFYPTPKEANEIVKTSGNALQYKLKEKEILFEVDNKKYQVSIDRFMFRKKEQKARLPEVQIALYKEELIVLKMIDEEQSQFIYLVDRLSGKRFCVYLLRN